MKWMKKEQLDKVVKIRMSFMDEGSFSRLNQSLFSYILLLLSSPSQGYRYFGVEGSFYLQLF
jgi:hypothetical protein